ncbi:phage virion morphogenesis protein [Paraburkholderia unamae]|uniref:phage virion morphogenesis protein n=1 Tax=Paraburkholderia unamae TaxID=219649 RepID=UPI000DC258A2|nr:phage virion morphogenesis protein [Paraburkholderia unamae]RAR53894.1 phage virion morphogenesis protein [Paraburkholderia unamae]
MNELEAIDRWAGLLLEQLSPKGRRAAMLELARVLRRSQQSRIAAQRNPDGAAYDPRKPRRQPGGKLRDKRGRVRRAAMFVRLRTTKYLKTEVDSAGLAIGFDNRVSRVARVHQFGETGLVAPHGAQYKYPARVLLGFTTEDRELVRDMILKHITKAA